MISLKKLKANRQNIKIANDSGKNRHCGESNYLWKGGTHLRGNYPCPQCKEDRICEKRYSHKICRKCWYNREKKFDFKDWVSKVRLESKEFAIKYKGGKCEMCGVGDLPNCCYAFHHKNRKEKEFNLGEMFNQKISQKVIKELDKCRLLCANCHAIETWLNKH